MAISASSAFGTPGRFQFQPRKAEPFEEFRFKLKAYLGLMNPIFKVVWEKVEENLRVEVNDKTHNDEQGNPRAGLVEMGSQLQWTLVSLCSGPASVFLRRETATNGFERWRQFVMRYKIPPQPRAMGKLSNIIKPNPTGTNSEDNLSTWEDEILRYDKEAASKLPGGHDK